MALLNLLLLPILMALGLWKDDGAGAGDAAADDPPAGDAKKTDDAATADGAAKTDTDDDAQLGDAGKRAIAEERRQRAAEKRRADAAEAELTRFREANQSESEKAINDAKKVGRAESDGKWQGLIRQARVESALAAAGCTDPSVVALARDFSQLNVNDQGEVEDLTATVQTFKDAHPSLFTARVPGGQIDQGAQRSSDPPATFEDAVTRHYQNAGSSS